MMHTPLAPRTEPSGSGPWIHPTALQAEMAGDEEIVVDERGYVERLLYTLVVFDFYNLQ